MTEPVDEPGDAVARIAAAHHRSHIDRLRLIGVAGLVVLFLAGQAASLLVVADARRAAHDAEDAAQDAEDKLVDIERNQEAGRDRTFQTQGQQCVILTVLAQQLPPGHLCLSDDVLAEWSPVEAEAGRQRLVCSIAALLGPAPPGCQIE